MKNYLKKSSLWVFLVVLTTLPLLLAGCGDKSSNDGKKAKFPRKPIEIVVGFAAGGANYMAADNLKPEGQAVFGQPIVITAKPGAASAIANNYVAMAAPDGHTVLNATMSLPVSLYTGSASYKKEDFIGVAMYTEVIPCLVVRADSPIQTLADLEKFAESNPNQFTMGHPGVGATQQIGVSVAFEKMGLYEKIRQVPFTGTNEAVAAVLGGHIDSVIAFPSSVVEQVKAGKLRVIGSTGAKRTVDFPDAKTFKEQGCDIDYVSPRGLYVRSNTPAEIVAILEAGFKKIIESPEFKERAKKLGEPAVFMNSKDFTAQYYKQCDEIEPILKKLGLAEKK